MPYKTIINSFLLSVILFFYIITNSAYLEPVIYPLIDRVVYSTNFVDKFFVNGYFGQTILIICLAIWILFTVQNKLSYLLSTIVISLLGLGLLSSHQGVIVLFSIISVPLVLILITINSLVKKKFLSFSGNLMINYMGISGIILALISLTVTGISLYYPDLSIPSVNYLYYIYLLASLFCPLLLLATIFSIPAKLVISKIHTPKILRTNRQSKIKSMTLSVRTRYWYVYLISIIIASIAISMIPQTTIVNPDNQLIGADSGDYTRLIESLRDHSSYWLLSTDRLLEQFSEDRVLSLFIFFFYSETMSFMETADELDHLPLILGPGLILSIFVTTRELTSNYSIALLSSFLTMVSFHLLIGIYSGFYANWLSLIIGYLSIYFLLRCINNPDKMNIILFSVLLILVLLTHASNWTILLLVIISFLTILMVRPGQKKRRKILLIYIALIPSILFDLLKLFLIEFSGLVGDINFAQGRVTGSPEINSVWNNIIETFHIQLGGIFGNPIIYILVLYWLYHYKFQSNPNMIIIIIFIILPIFPILFAETEIQSRILYIIPFQIPAAIGLFYLKCRYGNLIVFSSCICLIAVSIRLLSNFHFDVIDI